MADKTYRNDTNVITVNSNPAKDIIQPIRVIISNSFEVSCVCDVSSNNAKFVK